MFEVHVLAMEVAFAVDEMVHRALSYTMPRAPASSRDLRRQAGYREPLSPPGAVAEPTEPAGEILAPTADDLERLARLAGHERNRRIGLVVGVGILLRLAQWAPGWIPAVLVAGAAALGLYALLTWGPRGFGPAFLRFDPGGEVTAGFRLTVNVVLRPHVARVLDPLVVRLYARTGGERGEVVYESLRYLAERRPIGAGRAVRLATSIRIPEDVPVSTSGDRVRWRVEVTAGEPAFLSMSRAIQVRPSTRRPRRRRGPPPGTP
jgi:hypothetical protein